MNTESIPLNQSAVRGGGRGGGKGGINIHRKPLHPAFIKITYSDINQLGSLIQKMEQSPQSSRKFTPKKGQLASFSLIVKHIPPYPLFRSSSTRQTIHYRTIQLQDSSSLFSVRKSTESTDCTMAQTSLARLAAATPQNSTYTDSRCCTVHEHRKKKPKLVGCW